MGDEVDFLSADKHESLLEDESITLSVSSQACPKYLKQQVLFLSAKNCQRFLQIDTIILGGCSQACPN